MATDRKQGTGKKIIWASILFVVAFFGWYFVKGIRLAYRGMTLCIPAIASQPDAPDVNEPTSWERTQDDDITFRWDDQQGNEIIVCTTNKAREITELIINGQQRIPPSQ